MEVLIGFAVGYWVGARRGREGLDRALDSLRGIAASPETRHLLTQGLAGTPGKDSGNTGFTAIRDVLDELADRRGNHHVKGA